MLEQGETTVLRQRSCTTKLHTAKKNNIINIEIKSRTEGVTKQDKYQQKNLLANPDYIKAITLKKILML